MNWFKKLFSKKVAVVNNAKAVDWINYQRERYFVLKGQSKNKLIDMIIKLEIFIARNCKQIIKEK